MPPYILSAVLEGHSNDVKDATARSWARTEAECEQGGTWQQQQVYTNHEGFVNSVTWIPAGTSAKGSLVSGGLDSIIQVNDLASTSAEPTHTLLGHTHNVCCLHATSDGRIVSGSWDFTARVWSTSTWETVHVHEHDAAVWDVLAMESEKYEDTCVTACADGLVRIWVGDAQKHVLKGHTGPVRALAKVLPEDNDSRLFASASNDGTIRIWTLEGDALTVLDGHADSFVYSLISIPSSAGGGLASSGEDGIIKIWNDEDGEQEQEIRVPALSVWTLAVLPNGDLACGCSDKLIWIFSRDSQRAANRDTQARYESALEAQSKKTLAPKTHPPSELETPGDNDGQVKIVESDLGVHAHQWSAATSTWTNLGEVVSGPGQPEISSSTSQGKMEHEGEQYDYVFSVDVKDDAPPLKLPFNLGDDMHATAERFIKQHGLPESYLEQIVAFIRASAT